MFTHSKNNGNVMVLVLHNSDGLVCLIADSGAVSQPKILNNANLKYWNRDCRFRKINWKRKIACWMQWDC